MPNDFFRFKQFTVWQDRCALKVGTDSVLLGAWTCYAGAKRILDIGTGTGVLALIAAQRNQAALIEAVELDPASARQARDNVAKSAWARRIKTHEADIRCWSAEERHDLVLCNPPFYKNHPAPKDKRTASAKHEDSLDLGTLMKMADEHLAPSGRLSLILPVQREAEMLRSASAHGLAPCRLCHVHYRADKPAKRILVELARGVEATAVKEVLAVQDANGGFTPAYRRLLADLEEDF